MLYFKKECHFKKVESDRPFKISEFIPVTFIVIIDNSPQLLISTSQRPPETLLWSNKFVFIGTCCNKASASKIPHDV